MNNRLTTIEHLFTVSAVEGEKAIKPQPDVSGGQESTPGRNFLAGIINLNTNLGGTEEMNLK